MLYPTVQMIFTVEKQDCYKEENEQVTQVLIKIKVKEATQNLVVLLCEASEPFLWSQFTPLDFHFLEGSCDLKAKLSWNPPFHCVSYQNLEEL